MSSGFAIWGRKSAVDARGRVGTREAPTIQERESAGGGTSGVFWTGLRSLGLSVGENCRDW